SEPTSERPRPTAPALPAARATTGPVKAVPGARGTQPGNRPVPHVPESARPAASAPPKPAGSRTPTGAPAKASTRAELDSGPATQPVSVIEKNPKFDPNDGFLDELRKAVDDESPLGPPD